MNNKPAFPQQFKGTTEPSLMGLTMRDYIAVRAMQALLAGQSSSDGHWNFEAEASYEIADAMLIARE